MDFAPQLLLDPFTVLLIAGGISAGGSIISGIAARNQSKFQAQLAEQNAQQQRAVAALEAERHQRETGRRLGAISAAIGASGATFAGTPLLVLADEAAEAEENRLLILLGGEAAARSSEAQAAAFRQQGRNQLVSGIFGAGSTLLTTGADASLARSQMTAGNTFGVITR